MDLMVMIIADIFSIPTIYMYVRMYIYSCSTLLRVELNGERRGFFLNFYGEGRSK